MKKIRKIKKILKEAIQVEGAEHIGSDKGIDLFRINSYEAAQQFICHENNSAAGQKFIQSEDTFNNHAAPGGDHTLYFFTYENTNEVIAAMLSNQSWTIQLSNNMRFELNYAYEDFNARTNYNLDSQYKIPLHLLPGISISDYEFNNVGFIYQGHTLYAFVDEFYNDTAYNSTQVVIPEFITTICADAISEAISPLNVINEIVIPENVITIESEAIKDVNNISILRNQDDIPETFCDNWFIGTDVNLTFLDGELSEEEREQIRQERNNNLLNSYREEIDSLNSDILNFDLHTYSEYSKSNLDEINSRIDSLVDRFNGLPAMVKTLLKNNNSELKTNLENIIEDRNKWIQEYNDYIEEQKQIAIRNKFKYKEEKNHIVITGSNYSKNAIVEELIIPEEINGKPVTKIAPYAFYNNDTIDSIKLPNTIKEIGKYSLYWNSKDVIVKIPLNVLHIYYPTINSNTKLDKINIKARIQIIN